MKGGAGREVLVWLQPWPDRPPRWLEGLLARSVALARDLGAELSILNFLPPEDAGALALLHRAGVDRVLTAWSPSLASLQPGAWQGALEEVWGSRRPMVTLTPATAWGRRFMAYLAAGERVWHIPRCTRLVSIGDDRLAVMRLVLGGQMETRRTLPLDRPVLATWQPEHLLWTQRLAPAPAPVETLELRAPPAWPEIALSRRRREAAGGALPEAEIVVAGGAGAGDQEGFALVAALARALGGALAGSQVAAERGWIDRSQQIGRSGQSVFPDLFVACGISGSVHFTAGMEGAGLVVAINRDPEAPIFRLADYRIVGDLRAVIPALINQLSPREGCAG